VPAAPTPPPDRIATAIAAARQHAAEQEAEAERLDEDLIVVMRALGRARHRQFCLQSPIACVRDRWAAISARLPLGRLRA